MNLLIKNFLDKQKTKKQLSQETLDNYHFYLARFLKFSKIKSPDQITIDLIKKYRLWLGKQMSGRYLLDQSTQNYHLIALRSFIKYLNEKKLCDFNFKNIYLEKSEKKNIDSLDASEVEKLLKAPLQTAESLIIKLRDQAILELLFCSGLKVSEICNLKKKNLDLSQDQFKIINTKKERTCALSNQAKFALKTYLSNRKDKSDFLFVRHDRAKNFSQNAEHLTPRSIQRAVSFYGKLAGINKKITPQTLRHTFAYLLISEGEQIEKVQNFLGHATPASTKQYKNSISAG